ncbi:hypothetical protein RE6C_01202 [Rhodopirellula europaea 6C]|uniref:Uncharacterized protein n=1 Tax=Rhodopirellula europaea 6C TaxID=1263867 RepID=M2ALW7_9BACT|nr:hypothetical protein RE6C_01202 [Rhodopirellula europaea 6C]
MAKQSRFSPRTRNRLFTAFRPDKTARFRGISSIATESSWLDFDRHVRVYCTNCLLKEAAFEDASGVSHRSLAGLAPHFFPALSLPLRSHLEPESFQT